MPNLTRRARDHVGTSGCWHPLVLVALALSAWVYFPITRVYFFADDFVHLASIASDRTAAFLLRPFGGHDCLGRNLVFLASFHLFGLRANLYYWSVLLTHLLNVALLFGVVRVLSASAALACFGAALWGMSPLLLGTLGWYSVYGQVLATTTMLLVLLSLTRLAVSGVSLEQGTAWAWFALLLLGTTFFGVGIAVALVFPIMVFLLLPDTWRRPFPRATVLAVPIATVFLYFGLRRVAALVEPLAMEELIHEGLARSGFDAIPPMFLNLVAFSAAGTILGPFRGTYPDVRSVVAVVGLASVVFFGAWRGGASVRRAMLAMLVLACGIYLMIALGRAHTYQVFHVSPIRAASVGRYHYTGSVPVVVLFCLALQQVGQLGLLRAIPRGLALLSGLALLAFGTWRSAVPIEQRSLCRTYVERTMQEIREAVAARPPGATVDLENLASPTYLLGPQLPDRMFPGRAAVFVITNGSDSLDGHRLRFIERDRGVAAWYRQRPETRLGALLIAPEDSGTPP